MNHPPDCTCYHCLERMADPLCEKCGGDGYLLPIPDNVASEEMCKCTEANFLKKLEKAGIIKPDSTELPVLRAVHR